MFTNLMNSRDKHHNHLSLKTIHVRTSQNNQKPIDIVSDIVKDIDSNIKDDSRKGPEIEYLTNAKAKLEYENNDLILKLDNQLELYSELEDKIYKLEMNAKKALRHDLELLKTEIDIVDEVSSNSEISFEEPIVVVKKVVKGAKAQSQSKKIIAPKPPKIIKAKIAKTIP